MNTESTINKVQFMKLKEELSFYLNLHNEKCACCKKDMSINALPEEEFDEFPSRDMGYDSDGEWFCPECISQYKEPCAECKCTLTIDTPIMCYMNAKEGDATLCSECYWKCEYYEDDENEDNEDEINDFIECHKKDCDEEEEDEEVPYCYADGKYSAPIPCGCCQPCRVPESDDEEEEEEEEDEYTYYNYGVQKNGAFLVAGGGLGNGNACATIEKKDGKYYYCEYGKYPRQSCEGNTLIWVEKSPNWEKDKTGSFNIHHT